MNEDHLRAENIEVVEQHPWIRDSETYDGLDRRTRDSMAESPYISSDNPLHLGGVELFERDGGQFGFTFAEFDHSTARESERFTYRYGSEDEPLHITAAKYVAGYAYEDRNVVGFNGEAEDFTWWGRVVKKASSYRIRIYWSRSASELSLEE